MNYTEQVHKLKKSFWKAQDNYSKESTEANFKKVQRAKQKLEKFILTGKTK